jgi:hypothetical protein
MNETNPSVLSRTQFAILREQIHRSLDRAAHLREQTSELLLAAELLNSQRLTVAPRAGDPVRHTPQVPRAAFDRSREAS